MLVRTFSKMSLEMRNFRICFICHYVWDNAIYLEYTHYSTVLYTDTHYIMHFEELKVEDRIEE